MQTLNANDFLKLENGPCGKFPHTGPVYYGTGARPYTAAFKGTELKRADRKNREFKTAEAAAKAISAAAAAADEIEDALNDFNYVGSRHHY